MPDNSTIEKLISYMDGELNEAETEKVKKMLQEDASLQEYYQYLVAAKRAIKSQGLRETIQRIQQEQKREENGGENNIVEMVKPKFVSPTLMNFAVKLI